MIPDSVKLSDDKKSIIITYAERKIPDIIVMKLRAYKPFCKKQKNLKPQIF